MELKLPELGEGVHEGELLKWKVKPGDTVKDDQVLCEIMTDKATIELPSPFSGTVSELTAKEGEVVKVGQTMLKYDGTGRSASSSTASAATSHTASTPTLSAASAGMKNPLLNKANRSPAIVPNPPLKETAVSIGGLVAAAPSTRQFAREMNVALEQVRGSGPSGRITKEDVEAYVKGSGATSAGNASYSAPTARKASANGGEERVPFRGLRKKISEKMALSKSKAAHFTYVEECDATALVELRNAAKAIGEAQGIKVTYLPFVMKAMVAALKKYPILNAELDEAKAEIIYKHYYNISLSVQTEEGLSAPVIKDVGNKSILELAKDIQEVVGRARSKKLTMDDLTGGTITLTNAGTIGGLFATPIINYPEVAILGFNKIFRKAVPKVMNGKEELVIRDWTLFSISLDHRIVDGAIAAEFMKLFISYIENPALLVLEQL
jgi:pyruvate dehydrogenase E2 component (dihydrolipoamide acetyltransferase)